MSITITNWIVISAGLLLSLFILWFSYNTAKRYKQNKKAYEMEYTLMLVLSPFWGVGVAAGIGAFIYLLINTL